MKASRRSRRLHAAIVVLAAALAFVGCASVEKQVYVEWLPIRNPEALCKGNADCVQHSMYRGKPRCTIITADKAVSYERLGAQVRECLRAPDATARARAWA